MISCGSEMAQVVQRLRTRDKIGNPCKARYPIAFLKKLVDLAIENGINLLNSNKKLNACLARFQHKKRPAL